MKKYIQSIISFLFIFSMPFIFSKIFVIYENPFNFLDNPLTWLIIVGFGLVVFLKEVLSNSIVKKVNELMPQNYVKIQSLISFLFLFLTPFVLAEIINSNNSILTWIGILTFGLVIFVKEFFTITGLNKIQELEMLKAGMNPADVDIWVGFKKFIKTWTKSKPIEQESEIVLDHNYDGIRELDNSLPPWWVYMFYASIFFAVVYLLRFHAFDAPNQETEYNIAVKQANEEINKYKLSTPDILDIENITLLTKKPDLNRGKAIFKLNCASCHMIDGGGGIGPNLTDKNWILGGGIKNVFNSISNGGRDGKGMIAWKKTLKPKDIQKVASYILSLQGTTPLNPKVKEGEVWLEEIE
ncbi:MAG: cbb3-type cytochrome c oxidase N-terminal domain-containing protein [Flavobacteriaceae bacterium]